MQLRNSTLGKVSGLQGCRVAGLQAGRGGATPQLCRNEWSCMTLLIIFDEMGPCNSATPLWGKSLGCKVAGLQGGVQLGISGPEDFSGSGVAELQGSNYSITIRIIMQLHYLGRSCRVAGRGHQGSQRLCNSATPVWETFPGAELRSCMGRITR